LLRPVLFSPAGGRGENTAGGRLLLRRRHARGSDASRAGPGAEIVVDKSQIDSRGLSDDDFYLRRRQSSADTRLRGNLLKFWDRPSFVCPLARFVRFTTGAPRAASRERNNKTKLMA
jgi:hypothetical protein